MIGRKNLRTRNIKMFILDEADEMLNKGILKPSANVISPSLSAPPHLTPPPYPPTHSLVNL
jgi:superfamily II DNA/RNA helicase